MTSAAERPVLELRAVSKRYPGDDRDVLHEVNLRIYSGEFVAIVGASGSGKSTLMNILGLLDAPTSGELRIRNADATRLNHEQQNAFRRETLGFVLQSANTIDDESSLRNVALKPQLQGLATEDRWARAAAALAAVDLTAQAEQRTRTLSGGQRQRVAVARALAGHPTVLLADEPTGNLDPESADRVIAALQQAAARGVAVVLVTHDLERAKLADRVLRLEGGQLLSVREENDSRPAPAAAVSVLADEVQRPSTPERQRRAGVDLVCDALSSASLAPVRALFLLLAFAVSVGGLVAAKGLAVTAEVQVAAQFAAAANDRVQVSYESNPLTSNEFDRLAEYEARLSAVAEVNDVEAFVVAKDTEVTRFADASGESIRVIAATPGLLDLYGATTQPGHLGTALSLTSQGAIVSVDLLDELHLPASAATAPITPGYAIDVGDHSVPVLGTFQSSSLADGLSRTVIVPLDFLAGAPPSTTTVIAKTTVGFPSLVGDVAPAAMDPANPGLFHVAATGSLEALQARVSGDLAALVGVISGVLLLLAAVTSGAIMVIAVTTRRAEIALRRILGASRRQIAALFITEGALIGAAGGALGIGVGILALLLLAAAQRWVAISDPSTLPLALLVGIFAGLISAVFPAHKAASQPPAIALRG